MEKTEEKTYQIYARGYRPQTFEEMVGQKAIVQTLQNAIKTGRIGQAYLFAGMRGVGKTTAARILAKGLNCLKGEKPTPTPCNVCDSCVQINDDRSIDVLEIDGASNRSIEDVKSLRESVKYKAIRSRYKIVIIDEVHMLTREAFNALLKTLEEPPPGTVFIFATTELHKVLPTILSRCQVFEFKKPKPHDIIGYLKMIAGKEMLTISQGGLAMIAEASEGSLRDAVSLLDQAVAFCGNAIDDTQLKEMLGAINKDLLFEFSTAVLEEKPELIYSLTARVLDEGYDLRLFLKELILHFRNLLVAKTVKEPAALIPLANAEEIGRLTAEAGKAGEEDLLRYLQALQASEPGLKFSPLPQIHFETALVKMGHFRKLESLKDLLLDAEEIRKPGAAAAPDARPAKPAWPSPAPARKTTEPPAALREEFKIKTASQAPAAPGSRPEAKPSAAPVPAPPSPRKREEDAAMQDPGVRTFMDKFKARIITIEELKGKPDVEEN